MLDRVSTPATSCCNIGLECLAQMIGNTPLIRLNIRCMGYDMTVYAKAEMYNFSGSIKDRMALMIVRRAMERGTLQVGQTIVEATSGNAGIALAAIGSAIGCPVKIFMPDWMSEERKSLLRSYGASLELVSKEEGGFLGSIAKAKAFAHEHGAFLSSQFANQDNCTAHYQGTAPELVEQVASDSGELGAFVAGVGTGGTVMGVSRYLKEHVPSIPCHPMEPAESPTLSTGHKVGSHRIQGISDEFIPDIVKLGDLGNVVSVNDGDAILMAQRLCQEAGLGVGISSGANLIAGVKIALERGDGKAVGTIFCDGNLRYISTDLSGKEAVEPGYLAPQIELTGMKVIGSL